MIPRQKNIASFSAEANLGPYASIGSSGKTHEGQIEETWVEEAGTYSSGKLGSLHRDL